MNKTLLDQINSPADLKKLSLPELEVLAEEVRQEIIESVKKNGGHLSSSLGAVELTLALHYVFDLPNDKIIWDVGHQSYAHKILTGRRKSFEKLRRHDGCSGFPHPEESPEYDVSICGHAGVAISTALGIARGKASGDESKVIAFLGDGSLNCGISLEGLNQAKDSKLIIILNDNTMSISKNVGGMASYLNKLITARRYLKIKDTLKRGISKLPGSKIIIKFINKVEEFAKGILLPGIFFEELGIRYIGPISGHNFADLVRTLESVKNTDKAVIIHTVTQKGQGFPPAQQQPETYHGVTPESFKELPCSTEPKSGFSAAFGEEMLKLAGENSDIVAVVAAMAGGVGLSKFAAEYPNRLFDCGIAEAHSVVFAAGLCLAGKRPVVALYDTFLQRALDNVYHDVALGKLPVVFAIDRAGAVEDGPTHHGIYNLGFLRAMPNLDILSPKNEAELKTMLNWALTRPNPVLIRYPRGNSGAAATLEVPPIKYGKGEIIADGQDAVLWAMGSEVATALKIRQIVAEQHSLELKVINPRFIKPLDLELAQSDAGKKIFSLEDHSLSGGLASALSDVGIKLTGKFGWPADEIPHGKVEIIKKQHHIDPESIAEAIAKLCQKG